MRRKYSGFTLIEVLVVILIIAGCVLALRPFVKKARERAYSAACANNLRKLSIALYKYARDHDGSFPQAANLKELVNALAGPNALYAEDISIFVCPNTGRKMGSPGDMAGTPIDYMYISGLKADSRPDLPLAADRALGQALTKKDNHSRSGINVLYVSGNVKWLAAVPAGEWVKE